ncbi:FlaD/FlaE family flagellar protein [Methanocaldococcus villosus]|uniref:FlaD/FlaE family flagellar protein n=1 Tax=Methanocaldococcus villosus TaxID=667126 RepID=UPI000B26930C|nr:FlaD/FlaE family flagellar protein [Methanocaldococcus villosus]
MRGKRVTKRQLDKIVERVSEVLSKGKEDKTEELYKKLQSLEEKLDTIMKLTTVAVSTKISEEVEEKEEIKEEVIKEREEKEETKEEKEEVKEELPTIEEKEEEKEEEPEIKIEPEIKVEEVKEGEVMIEEEKKYILNDIPEDAVSMALAFKWLEFLINRVGISNLPDILDFYNKIGWISSKVVLKLLKFAKNMRVMVDENIKVRDKLTPSEHIMSLMYIEKLAGAKVDPETLEMLELELRRIKKWVEELKYI